MLDVEIISVHYKTPSLIYNQYDSIRKLYPDIKYRIIDGSDDDKKYFNDLEKKDKNFTIKRFGYNIHHGPGMDYGIKSSNNEFLLILDSDITIKKELLTDMMFLFKGFSVGKKIIVNSNGFEKWQKNKESDNEFIYNYVHPYCMLLKKDEYLKHRPFIKHGAPCIETMIDIHNKNLSNMLSHIEIEEYINLKIRGTRKIWGINL
jgi:hypothetical protein